MNSTGKGLGGLDWETLVKCDLMYLVEKERLYRRRGSVGTARRRALVQRINACFGFTLVIAPAPDTWHQSWIGDLYALLRTHVLRNKLGKVLMSPVDVVLDPENTVQPDIVFVASASLSIIQRPAIFGVPDLLIELVSPSSVRRDRYDKKSLYARFGVKEYWIGDPANKALEILTLKNGNCELHCCAEEKGRLTSLMLPGLEFDLSEIQ